MANVDVPGHQAIEVEVVFSPTARAARCVTLRLAPGSTLAQAVQASHLLDGLPEQARADLSFSVWNRSQPPDHVLRDRDRVEVCRPLTVDPKEARRQRYRREGLPRTRKSDRPAPG